MNNSFWRGVFPAVGERLEESFGLSF